jgi:two-component system sensor histidine kinase AlgZ
MVWEIAPESEAVQVPSMLLQPLLENAVRHGIARRTEPGEIHLSSHLDGGVLDIAIANDVGAEATRHESEDGHGMGLSLTRARLAEAYGDKASLETVSEANGFSVRLRLPADRGGV